jgi:hypothetical protein
MRKRKLKLGFVSKREIDMFKSGIDQFITPRENKIAKAVSRMASQFEKDLFEFALEKMVKKVLSVKHTEYRWDEGRIDTYYKFFTEDEKDTAIEYAKNFGENVVNYDFTKLAEMSDEEFLRTFYIYTGDNEELVRKWRNAVRK